MDRNRFIQNIIIHDNVIYGFDYILKVKILQFNYLSDICKFDGTSYLEIIISNILLVGHQRRRENVIYI